MEKYLYFDDSVPIVSRVVLIYEDNIQDIEYVICKLIKKNEEIHTENSHKYTIKSFKNLANKAGWKLDKTWIDGKKLFSVHCLS